MKRVRAVLFDYGHTLVDVPKWEEYLLRLHGEVAPWIGAAVPELDGDGARLGRGLHTVMELLEGSYRQGQIEELEMRQLYREAFQSQGVALPERVVEQLVEADHDLFARAVRVADTAPALLEELRRRGYRLGVVSNNIFYQESAIELFPLLRGHVGPVLEAVALSSYVGRRKPDPAIYQAVLGHMRLEPEEVIFVGDRLREDVRGPLGLGMAAAYLTHEFRQEPDEAGEAAATLQRVGDLVAHLP